MNEAITNGLAQLDMLGDANRTTGLVPVSYLNTSRIHLVPEEVIALENAASYNANYVYFRTFSNRPPVVQVYLYDYTEHSTVDHEGLISLHKQLYSSGLTPMFFVFTKSQVIIFNCLERPSEGKELKYKPLTTIQLAAEVSNAIDEANSKKLHAFSGRAFDNGTFWEDSTYSGQFKAKNSAYEKLLAELKQALKDIIAKEILPATIARKFIVISILIKYLEDRLDREGNSVFPKYFFNDFLEGAESFVDVLKNSDATLKLLDDLASHFGGEVFKITSDEREAIATISLNRFAQFLRVDSEGIQLVLWKLYSFNDLPIELISNIYEEFLGKQPGVVYTPPYLVNFLLDEVMPLSDGNTNVKILDPACGSGVFLVGAYRRLIQRWRVNNNWETPDLPILKALLKQNIYGIDKDPDATNLTVFSLSLALCDELTPKQIWEELHFDNLRESNIKTDDFFNQILIDKEPDFTGFDLVIGNPPFDSNLTEAAYRIDVLETNSAQPLFNGYSTIQRGSLPDSQIALLFLEQSVKICKQDGLTCLIQPAGPLLYNNSSINFRNNLFRNHYIPQIIDFTHISRTLFGERGDVATAAIFIKNEPAKNKGLLHITVRRTKPNKEKLYFELDSYDFHYVPREIALNDSYIWKANFLGGHRYHQLISRLNSYSTLGVYLAYQKEHRGWAVSEGYTLATKNDTRNLARAIASGDVSEQDKIEQKLTADFITGKNHLPTQAFTEKGIDLSKIHILREKYFHSKGDEQIYHPPHILIKKIVANDTIPIALSDEYLVFNSNIIGVHAPDEDIAMLNKIVDRFENSDIYSFYLAATSGRYMINKSSSVLKKDIINLPYTEDGDEIELDAFEQILVNDFKNFLLAFRRNGENSEVADSNASDKMLIEFGETYCKVLNSVYKSIKPYDYFETDSFICYPFYSGNKPPLDFSSPSDTEKHIATLAIKLYGVNLRIVRTLRMYDHNVIYLIKPKKARYWIQSIALRDADETFSDLRKQGY